MAGPFLREFSEFSIFARFLVKTYKIAKLWSQKKPHLDAPSDLQPQYGNGVFGNVYIYF